MNSISNRHYGNHRFKLSRRRMFDFQLVDSISEPEEELPILIDLTYGDDVLKNKVEWEEAVCDVPELKNFGLTAVDNGRVKLESDFLTTLKSNPLNLDSKTFELHKVSGYENESLYNVYQNAGVLELRGGFFQGFYKLDGYNYQTLPNHFERGWTISVDLKRVRENGINSINKPDTKGFFYFVGARAENKYWNTFEGPEGYEGVKETTYDGVENFYDDENYFIIPLNPPRVVVKKMENEFLIYGRSSGNKICTDNDTYTFGTHRAGDVDKNPKLRRDDDGTELFYTSHIKLESYEDVNPFLKYGRSNGKPIRGGDDTPHNDHEYIDDNGDTVVVDYGTARAQDDINKLEKELNPDLDLPDNALGFRVKDDGSVGYRRIIRKDHCLPPLDSDLIVVETEDYIVIEEYSAPDLVRLDEWANVTLKWETDTPYDCHSDELRMGKLYLYVNGYLKHYFAKFEEIKNRGFEDDKDKQLGVPYNISIGGGTQGLMENQTFGGQDPDDLGLPLERHFAGVFIGDLKNFRMYGEPLTWCDIKNITN